ncbi:MAG: recombinase family protein [Saprospiraceae bacterium]|nr:recombinase family protein [Candidatus Defluviibacterium haderslevense]
MKKVFGYTRVSTVKQGNGVSLQEQKEAISRYADKNNLHIIEWFEELETAAKQGRPLFNKMLKLIREKKAEGTIIHKIDRSARNLRDWASLGDLIDEGFEIYFAHESLDLNERGGRLAADIQAVIASDYIRNLRDEAIKGLYGRLKQGILPFAAPIGYINTGSGKLKEIDPIMGPLVKKAFELYASEKYNLNSLANDMNLLGLRNLRGNEVNKATLSIIFNNPFYIGIMKIKGINFSGNHEPLISSVLYKKVQSVLKGKTNTKIVKHGYLYNKLIKCKICEQSLTGEKQKGNIYYRCHMKGCKTKGLREDYIEKNILLQFEDINLQDQEKSIVDDLISDIEDKNRIREEDILKSIRIQESQLNIKLERLTDALIDNNIDKGIYEERKEKIYIEKKGLQERKTNIDDNITKIFQKTKLFFELLKSLKNLYIIGNYEEKRKLLKIITSNLLVEGKKLMITVRNPFQDIALTHIVSSSGQDQANPRTCTAEIANQAISVDKNEVRERMKELVERVNEYFKQYPNEIELEDNNE